MSDDGEDRRTRVLVLTPLRPAAAFNGMAMRGRRIVDAFGDDDLTVVVLPAADLVHERRRGAHDVEPSVVPLECPSAAAEGAALAALLAQARWRARLQAMDPLPGLACRVPVSWWSHVVESLGSWRPEVVVVQRSYLAPVGLAVAEHFGARTVLDLDDDDVGFLVARSDPDADAFERLVATAAPAFDLVLAASEPEAAAIAARHGIDRPVVFPNAVPLPESLTGLPVVPDDRGPVALLVGNFGYAPNREGLAWLRDEVVPHLHAPASGLRIQVVGPGLPPEEHRVAGGVGGTVTIEHVGPVGDLAHRYAAASVVLVPVLTGGGTRTKVLEALAHGRPVVATTLGVAGLPVRDGVESLLADDPVAFAAAIRRVLDDRSLALRLVSAGRAAAGPFDAPTVSRRLRAEVGTLLAR